MILALISFMRDNFKAEYGDSAYMVLICHCIVIVICIFADVLKKKIEDSNFKWKGVEITEEDKSKIPEKRKKD
jgi:hypothetical protein